MKTKPFFFRRLPLLRTEPVAWRRHLELSPSLPTYLNDPELTMTPAEVRQVMEQHMPELLPEFDSLLGAFSDGPVGTAQCLAMYNIRPFFAGCSCTVRRHQGAHTLLRNYDLGLDDHDGFFRYEPLPDGGWILGSAEGGWGYVDGLNDRGLAVAITFGGKFIAGEGFAVPIIVRYLLQTCATVAEAVQRLGRLPHRLAQNLILLDRTGASAVAYCSPDEGVIVDHGASSCTNHQRRVVVQEHGQFVRTVERLEHLHQLGSSATLEQFLQPPLYNALAEKHFATIYSVEIDPAAAKVRYLWPDRELLLSPDSPEADLLVSYPF